MSMNEDCVIVILDWLVRAAVFGVFPGHGNHFPVAHADHFLH